MIESTVRRAAALAADVAPAPATQTIPASAPAPAQQTQAQIPAPEHPEGATWVVWCHHRYGLLPGLLEGVGDLLGALL